MAENIDPFPEKRDPTPTTERQKEDMRQRERRRLSKEKAKKRLAEQSGSDSLPSTPPC
jgi:elongation factor P--beta-lysine ligase